MANQSLCTFYLGDLFLGIPVTRVQEVIRFQEMTTVPLAPKEVLGLINLRGQIVTAMDLRGMLGMPSVDVEDSLNVVLRDESGEAVSFLVDQAGDVIEVSEDECEVVPATVDPSIAPMISSVYKLDGQLLLVLDTDRAQMAAAPHA